MNLDEDEVIESVYLDLSEVLIALSVCSITNPIIEKAINELENLRGCEAHVTYMISKSELVALLEPKVGLPRILKNKA